MFHVIVNFGRWLALAGAFFLVALPVYAQDDASRLDRLERDIQTLSRTVYKGEKPPVGPLPGSGMAPIQNDQMDDRLNRLEQDLRDLTGKVEEQGFVLNQLRTQLEQQRAAAVAPVPQPAPIAVTPPPAQPVAPPAPLVMDDPNAPAPATAPSVEPLGQVTTTADGAVATIPAGDDPTATYEAAVTLLKQRDYPAAEKALTDFIKQNPKHNLAQNARYWLGEGYFAQSKYELAARTFAEGYQLAPKGPKAADNLLKMGLSLAAMNNTADACVALGQIAKDFPKGQGPTTTRAAAEMKRLKCNG